MADSKKQVYLWYGDNDFEIHEKVNQWRDIFEKKYSSLNFVVFDLKDGGGRGDLAKDLKNALQVDSLFGANKLVILKNFLGANTKLDKDSQELLINFFDKLSESFFIIFVEIGAPDKRGKIYKTLISREKSGSAELKEFILPRDNILARWVAERAKKYNAVLDASSISFLVSLVGPDLWQLDQELCKLASYKKNALITNEDIKLLVHGKYNEDIFALMDAISAKNKIKALKLFQDQIDSGANSIYLLTMMIRQFRILYQIKEFSANNNFTADIIGRETGIHPFVVRKTIPYLRGFTTVQLKTIFQQLLQFEIQMKTKSTNFEALFDLLIAKL
jgi:DNA polymerase-3 subunit delta